MKSLKTYLTAPPGTGKTQRLTERLAELISAGTRPDRILVIVPQRAQAERYRAALARVRGNTRGEPQITTFTGLVQQHVSLFFPLMAGLAGFEQPGREPIFLNIESTQYFLNRVVEPRKADFDELKLSRPRLLGQILDSMTKAALVGFPLSELAERLGSAWAGAPERLKAYAAMQEAALAFRAYCLQHTLLDFSLVMEMYARHLLPSQSYRDYIVAKHRHVIADNIEEGVPVLHDFVRLLLNTCDSALLAEDDPGGYRIFLGADGVSARRLRDGCDEVIEVASLRRADLSGEAGTDAAGKDVTAPPDRSESRTDSAAQHLAQFLFQPEAKPDASLIRAALGTDLTSQMYWQGMVREVATTIKDLISEGTRPNEIAVISPFVEDVLLFELRDQLQGTPIAVRPLRPSRPLSDHPITRAMLAWTKLAYPEWEMFVSEDELARALSVCIAGLDVPRAQLLAKAAQRISVKELPVLEDQKLLNRVGMRFREPYLHLQRWLSEVRESATLKQEPLDVFWQRMLAHVLVAEGFALALTPSPSPGGRGEPRDLAVACDKLIRSARIFRETLAQTETQAEVSREYVKMIGMGLMAAQSVNERAADEQAAFKPDPNAILLSPAYAYLTNDFRGLYRRYQFWLNTNSLDWYRRIVQPLTHPYVLSRNWLAPSPVLTGEGWGGGRKWTDMDEHREQDNTLRRLVSGLAYRCTGKVFIASSQINLRGEEESGPLQRVLRKALVSMIKVEA